MLYYDRIDLSKGIDISKINSSRGYFIHGFEFWKSVADGCHDLLMLCLNTLILALLIWSLLKVLIIVLLITWSDPVIIIICVIKDSENFYLEIFLEEALVSQNWW